jgi:hypothetical protein
MLKDAEGTLYALERKEAARRRVRKSGDGESDGMGPKTLSSLQSYLVPSKY